VARPARNKLESCMLTVFVECVWVDDLADKSGKKDRRPSSGCRRKRECVCGGERVKDESD